MIFDSIVIGKGLIGTAAVKYLSIFQDKVAVVGPDEPVDANDAVVFSSHYDQARIHRIIGTDPRLDVAQHSVDKSISLFTKRIEY